MTFDLEARFKSQLATTRNYSGRSTGKPANGLGCERFRSHSGAPIGGSGLSPSHHLELRRPGGGQAITHAVDVRWRDVDA